LIEAGKFYRAVPPLYGIKVGKTQKYFTSTIDFTKYIQGIFMNRFTLTDIKDKNITRAQATGIFYRNRNYVRDIEIISSTYAIDPDLLESVLYELAPYIVLGSRELICNMAARAKAMPKKKASSKKDKETIKKAKGNKNIAVNEDELDEEETLLPITDNSVLQQAEFYISPEFSFRKMSKNLKKKYRFLELEKVNDTILLKGLVNSRYQYVFLNDKFINSCVELLNIIKSNDEYYKIDGNAVTIYGLMKAFEAMQPSGITRYKGLGEQNPDQLGESAMRPDGYRTLIRYTIESAKEEIESIREVESNMYSLLRELKVDRSEVE
jgi:DNA gyrase/topoisomerase IV subunit B